MMICMLMYFTKPGAKRCGVSDVSDTHITICVLVSHHDGESKNNGRYFGCKERICFD